MGICVFRTRRTPTVLDSLQPIKTWRVQWTRRATGWACCRSAQFIYMGVRTDGVSWSPWKNVWKIKKRKHAKNSSFLCLCYILIAIRAGRCRERRYADNIFYSDILQNAPFRSQIFIIFFASGSKGALTPLTKILRTFLFIYAVNKSGVGCEPIANVFWSPTTLNFQHSRS